MPYFRGESSDHVVQYVNGKIKQQGRGLSFWFLSLNTTIAIVPLNVRDVPFVFSDVTADFQSVTYQGQATYRFVDPQKALETLNLTIEPRYSRPKTQDLEMLGQRVTNAVNSACGSEIQAKELAVTLRNFEQIADAVRERLRNDSTIQAYGLEIVNLVITSIQPTPEVGKALEAEFREGLLRKADEAVYARRAASIEEERKIKEREMETQRTLAIQRKELITLESENQLSEAKARGEAFAAENQFKLEQLQNELSLWKGIDAGRLTALGIRSMGEHGVSNITITTEMLSALLQHRDPSE